MTRCLFMRSILGVATVVLVLLVLPNATALGSPSRGSDTSSLRHRLVLSSPSIVAGDTEHAVEVARNDHPFPVEAWVSWVVTFPCGGGLIGDPVTQTMPANGGVARWRLDVATSSDCVGTYTVQTTITDRHGSGQDEKTFDATP